MIVPALGCPLGLPFRQAALPGIRLAREGVPRRSAGSYFWKFHNIHSQKGIFGAAKFRRSKPHWNDECTETDGTCFVREPK